MDSREATLGRGAGPPGSGATTGPPRSGQPVKDAVLGQHGEAIGTPHYRRLRSAAHWLRALYGAGFDVVMIFEAATEESPETRALLRSKLAGRNEVMDAMIASLDGKLRVSVREAQAVYRALAAPGVYRELVVESGWTEDDFERWLGGALERHLFGLDVISSPLTGQPQRRPRRVRPS